MTEFITDDFGNKTFTHEGWVVKIWSRSGGDPSIINVESPDSDEQVEVLDRGLWTFGEVSTDWNAGSPTYVIIPWIVIAAIVDARAIVASEKGE